MRFALPILMALAATPASAADGFVYTYLESAPGEPNQQVTLRFTENFLSMNQDRDGGMVFSDGRIYAFDERSGRYRDLAAMMANMPSGGGAPSGADPFAQARAQMELALKQIPAGPQREAMRKMMAGKIPPPPSAAASSAGGETTVTRLDERMALPYGDCQRVAVARGGEQTMRLCVVDEPDALLGGETFMTVIGRFSAAFDEAFKGAPSSVENPFAGVAKAGGPPLLVEDLEHGGLVSSSELISAEAADIAPPPGL